MSVNFWAPAAMNMNESRIRAISRTMLLDMIPLSVWEECTIQTPIPLASTTSGDRSFTGGFVRSLHVHNFVSRQPSVRSRHFFRPHQPVVVFGRHQSGLQCFLAQRGAVPVCGLGDPCRV